LINDIIGLYIFSVISLLHHKVESDALMTAEFMELNELFDGKLNPFVPNGLFSASNDQMETKSPPMRIWRHASMGYRFQYA
jgi:hypothetical protein